VKKGISILMVFLVLTSMFHLTIATHYCCGKVIASKISVTGKLATCGMEAIEEGNLETNTLIRKHCCEDVVTSYNIDNNYSPSNLFLTGIENFNINNLFIVDDFSFVLNTHSSLLFTDISPPGWLMYTDVDLSDICVLRI
jgi:hypothetical protein